jgi:C1A family cysteine protease
MAISAKTRKLIVHERPNRSGIGRDVDSELRPRLQSVAPRQKGYRLGWRPDVPDFRDYSPTGPEMRSLLGGTRVAKKIRAALPPSVDLSGWCSPVEDQGDLGSCTAQAGVGLIEYFERRAFGSYSDASRLFLYKVTRNLMELTGDTGAYLRDTMKAMVLFGVPPERYLPYDVARFDDEPNAFLYAFAQAYQTIKYFRLDEPGVTGAKLTDRVKQLLVSGYPSMFGFTVYNFGNEQGEFEFPDDQASALGGHAVLAVGYDDGRRIGASKGALKIRNSWGTTWGDQGYGWLPYDYIEAELAMDFWSLSKKEYVDTGKFE